MVLLLQQVLSQLPHPFDTIVSWILLVHIPNADSYLFLTALLSTALVFIQIHAFTRPPPVPLKVLPRRPALQILFKPDDISSSPRLGGTPYYPSSLATTSTGTTHYAGSSSMSSSYPRHNSSISSSVPASTARDVVNALFHHKTPIRTKQRDGRGGVGGDSTGSKAGGSSSGGGSSRASGDKGGPDVDQDQGHDDLSSAPSQDHDDVSVSDDDDDDVDDGDEGSAVEEEPPFLHTHDLPDSFAPLLSSSEMEVLLNQLTTDLIHAIHVEAGVRMREGRHEIPLHKDTSRPQLVFDVGKGGCRVTAVAGVGSDGFSSAEDLDVTKPTKSRSWPMVKHAGLVLDPPLPLANVAPTLIHFPTLFEDNVVPTLRRIQIVRFALDLVVSFSSLLEKMLWIIESKCQIHLSQVRVIPLYKGSSEHKTPQWRLNLSFSGHVLLFGWIPIPFISVTLPTFIIPQPHALLKYLLTSQPLASARLRRENISEQRILLAILDTVETWKVDAKAVATPPALGVDVTLPGGVTIAVEMMHGRDVNAVVRRPDGSNASGAGAGAGAGADPYPPTAVGLTESNSGNSVSSWTTYPDSINNPRSSRSRRTSERGAAQNFHSSAQALSSPKQFDANALVPWFLEVSVRGYIDKDKLTINLMKCTARHEDISSSLTESENYLIINPKRSSQFNISGSAAICKADPISLSEHGHGRKKTDSHSRLNVLNYTSDPTSVCSILLYPEKTTSSSSTSSKTKRISNLLQYDYGFDIGEDTKLDAVSLSVGASHPMLKGGTMITTILESIYAFGAFMARDGSMLDMSEKTRKRNILRHLPAVDFTAGIQNAYFLNMSFSDDGQTRCVPELNGGRMMIRVVGGLVDDENGDGFGLDGGGGSGFLGGDLGGHRPRSSSLLVSEGIKLVADFGVSSFALNNEAHVNEFPELDIFEESKLYSLLSGTVSGRISSHLRPQSLKSSVTTTGPNIFNPLEAYEVDFSGSSVSLRIKESWATLGHRRIIIPTETTFAVKVVESIVDMSMEGKTQCELSWDFQGSSPILQVTSLGHSPAEVTHEDKSQVALLIAPLRQGRLNFHVSSVGGIDITQAATSRENREGLYDWKFFNALVSPDQESAERIVQVLHDKRTMYKLLQVIRLVNSDLEKILRYVLTQVWRAKEIFDQEGVSDPGQAIPGHKMARLISLFLCGNVGQSLEILAIIRRVTRGEGLDVVRVKELLRKHLSLYVDYASEIDRAVRWAAVALGPMPAPQPFVESGVPALSELPCHAKRFLGIPSAKELYSQLADKRHLPLDASFSNLVSRVAPYMSFRQIEYVLQARSPSDWQPSDLRRLRYVYSVKKKVLDISESYGGLSFLPQSFLVSVFLGEATRASLRASCTRGLHNRSKQALNWLPPKSGKSSTISTLRRRRMLTPHGSSRRNGFLARSVPESQNVDDIGMMSPASRVASLSNFCHYHEKKGDFQIDELSDIDSLDPSLSTRDHSDHYELGDSLLGPQDVAILLQAGLTSAMKGSTVVQLNQRMLLDLMASQPRGFAVAVLAEIGTPGGNGSLRSLTSALMALLELDQSSFAQFHRLDMHALLESWLPGSRIPRREDYLAGGRWARQSYYEAIFGVAKNILEDAECYMALKGHVQRVRHQTEDAPIPLPKELESASLKNVGIDIDESSDYGDSHHPSKLTNAIDVAKSKIAEADCKATVVAAQLLENEKEAKQSESYRSAVSAYREAFDACTDVLNLDKLAFQADWFKRFYRRNYDALMVKSVYDNVVENVDHVREWLDGLRRGAYHSEKSKQYQRMTVSSERAHEDSERIQRTAVDGEERVENIDSPPSSPKPSVRKTPPSSPTSYTHGEEEYGPFFADPEKHSEQALIDAIIDVLFYNAEERENIRKDPLVRFLISNPPGQYNFTIISAMGVITEGKKGQELSTALSRLEQLRGVKTIRADTGTARSFEFNASKIEEAIESAMQLQRPFGLLGYSQGCANALMAESLLFSGSPKQQQTLKSYRSGLVCRQLLFSAANGSVHGPAFDMKVQRLIVMCEEFFKYQQGYCSRAFISTVLEVLTNILDSAAFHKLIGGAQTFVPEGSKAFWREAQHLPHVPTTVLRGVLEDHTTPESLEMISNLLTKQSGSALHDSQVHVYDAVGHPVYIKNRNGKILKNCDMGGAVQRTHHWSPLCEEVDIVKTKRDVERSVFECAKDRHVFPWVDVNARFGVIKYCSHQTK